MFPFVMSKVPNAVDTISIIYSLGSLRPDLQLLQPLMVRAFISSNQVQTAHFIDTFKLMFNK